MHIDDDDRPVGRILTRRDAVRLLATGAGAIIVGCKPGARGASVDSSTGTVASLPVSASSALPACVGKPELTVGPYFVDKQLDRSDIRLEPSTNVVTPGAPLQLTFRVQQIANGQCAPLPNAMVDVWQCDALGRYSGVNDRMVGFDTSSQKFLRGYQITDASGIARFTTIYPGWYQGRAVHIHFKIRTPAQAAIAGQDDKIYEFTSQLFFDEAITDKVHEHEPYASKGQRRLRNERDGIFRQSGGTLMLPIAPSKNETSATFDVGLDLSNAQVGRPERSGRGGPPRSR